MRGESEGQGVKESKVKVRWGFNLPPIHCGASAGSVAELGVPSRTRDGALGASKFKDSA